MHRLAAVALAVLALSACDRDRERDGPLIGGEPETVATPEPSTAGKSIFRDEVDPADVEAQRPVPLETTIGFPDGGLELDMGAQAELATVMESPQYAAGGPIVLRGHSDASGSGDLNLRTSRERAEAVRDWLVENGAEEDRFTIIAFGEQNPVEPNALPDGTPNERGRAVNRRVEIHIGVRGEGPPAPLDPEQDQPTTPEEPAE